MQRSQRDSAPLQAEAATPDVPTTVVRGGSSDSRVGNALSVVAILVVLAVLKPWGAGSPIAIARPFVPDATTVAITPSPTEDRSADGLASPLCLGTGGWRIASLEQWRTQDVRVWRAIEPITSATGPLDPTIPSVPIVALEVTALGWCAPAFGPGRPEGPAVVTAWSVRDGEARRLDLEQAFPVEGSTPIAAFYVPLTLCPETNVCLPLLPAARPRPWATERVTFEFVDKGTGQGLWFAADLTIVPGGATPSPISGAAAVR